MTDLMRAIHRKLANIFAMNQNPKEVWDIEDPEIKHCVARPSIIYPRCTWSAENILVLTLSDDNNVRSFAKSLCTKGADITFGTLNQLEDIFHFPLEQYTMVIMGTGASEPDINVADIGGFLRRADQDLTLVWASSQFKISIASDSKRRAFCDIQLAVPTLPETLSVAMGWPLEKPLR
jgi:hypothetical protein